jgi:predicted SAM-dependent methyltransferase
MKGTGLNLASVVSEYAKRREQKNNCPKFRKTGAKLRSTEDGRRYHSRESMLKQLQESVRLPKQHLPTDKDRGARYGGVMKKISNYDHHAGHAFWMMARTERTGRYTSENWQLSDLQEHHQCSSLNSGDSSRLLKRRMQEQKTKRDKQQSNDEQAS